MDRLSYYFIILLMLVGINFVRDTLTNDVTLFTARYQFFKIDDDFFSLCLVSETKAALSLQPRDGSHYDILFVVSFHGLSSCIF